MFEPIKKLNVIIICFLISFGSIGGCGNNSGNDETNDPGLEDPEQSSSCQNLTNPCSRILDEVAGQISCDLSKETCGVDLMDVFNQIQENLPMGNQVTTSTKMWIQVWGGKGGKTTADGGKEGYSQITTTIDDINMNLGTMQLYYFLAEDGKSKGTDDNNENCGGAGGSSSIVTLEDLTVSPDKEPSPMDILLLAGGGGGGSGCNAVELGCPDTEPGGDGGIAIANESNSAHGAGGGDGVCISFGGDMGSGGELCQNCTEGDPKKGKNGYGGIGGSGGSGDKCKGPDRSLWVNTGNSMLNFDSGEGGKGGSNTDLFEVGGGGGGGGWGGGGGGGSSKIGIDTGAPGAGGGGGSFAIQSTKTTKGAPESKPDNPCNSRGCVLISFEVVL